MTTYEKRALKSILRGELPEKKVWVFVGDIKSKEQIESDLKREEKTRRNSEVLKLARKPWFCPKCDMIMKTRLDDKMWNIYQTCFNCVVKAETNLRIAGKFEEYEKQKMVANAIAELTDYKSVLEENLTNIKNPEFITEFGGIERWDGISIDDVKVKIQNELDTVKESLVELKNGSG